jgi:hypothetical protein
MFEFLHNKNRLANSGVHFTVHGSKFLPDLEFCKAYFNTGERK